MHTSLSRNHHHHDRCGSPYYYLANALGAYVDSSPLWRMPDATIAAAADADAGGLEAADAAARLCGFAACDHAWGLPHVLRAASREGAGILQSVLADCLPDSFFPGPTPFTASSGDGRSGGGATTTVQVLASVQGATAAWRPRWLELPELAVRADVVARGPRLEAALAALAALVEADLADLAAAPTNFSDGVAFVDPAAERGRGGEQGAVCRAGDRHLLKRVLSWKKLLIISFTLSYLDRQATALPFRSGPR